MPHAKHIDKRRGYNVTLTVTVMQLYRHTFYEAHVKYMEVTLFSKVQQAITWLILQGAATSFIHSTSLSLWDRSAPTPLAT